MRSRLFNEMRLNEEKKTYAQYAIRGCYIFKKQTIKKNKTKNNE